MFSAHSKDNGSPTSVAHKLDQTDSVVVRRDDLVVVDNGALGTLCEDVQIASRRNAGVLEVEWFRNGAELTLFQTFAKAKPSGSRECIPTAAWNWSRAARRRRQVGRSSCSRCTTRSRWAGASSAEFSIPLPLPEDKN